jgi:putative acetyltransferase
MMIRPSRPEDADRIIAIWRDAVDATHDFLTREDRLALDDLVCGFLPEAPCCWRWMLTTARWASC